MSRTLAILIAVVLIGLAILEGATEQNKFPGDIDQKIVIANLIAQMLLTIGFFSYCGFAALHSTQYISSPRERSIWLLATVVLNVVGSCAYYLMTYQSFRKAGLGHLMRFRKPNKRGEDPQA